MTLKTPTVTAKRLRCPSCGEKYIKRERGTVCLTCDILARAHAGESPERIAERFGLPRFLIRKLLDSEVRSDCPKKRGVAIPASGPRPLDSTP